MIAFRHWLCLCLVSVGFSVHAQGKFIQLPEQEVKLYYEDTGSGRPLVFIPGWTMTTRFFEKQKAHFSKTHRFISMDPRGQGQSEKTADKHTYEQHARDLHEFLETLNLKDAVLIGWSSGCITLFEYKKQFGNDRTDQFVFIDETPKWIGDIEKEWVYGSFEGYKGSLAGLLRGRDPASTVDWMLGGKADSQERTWMVEEMLKTPDDVALRLYIDGVISDYTQTVKEINTKVPSVFLLRESWYAEAREWLDKEAPALAKDRISSHAMFWAEPVRFNQILERYLPGR